MVVAALGAVLVLLPLSRPSIPFAPALPGDQQASTSDTPGGVQQLGGEEAPWKQYASTVGQQQEEIPLPKGDKLYKMVNRSIALCVEECEDQKKEVQQELDKVNAEIAELEEAERKAQEAAMHKAKHEKCTKQAVLLSAQVANLTDMMAAASGSAKINNDAAKESQEIIKEQAAMLKEQKEKLDELTTALKARNEMTDTTASIQQSLEEVKQQLKNLKSTASQPRQLPSQQQQDKTGLTAVYMPSTGTPPDAVTSSTPDAFAKGKPAQ